MTKKRQDPAKRRKRRRPKPSGPGAPGPGPAIPKAVRKVGCATVDNSPNDTQGFLKDTQARLHLPSHGTTAAAVENLIKCLKETEGRSINLIGHGWDGCISTGIGEGPPGPDGSDGDRVVKFDNEQDWTVLGKLKDLKVSSLTLWGCNTGAGKPGAKLLWEIANLIDAPVSAPTGFVYPGGGSDDFRLEPRSTMQRAEPGAKAPAPKNSPKYLKILKTTNRLKVKFDGTVVSIPLTDLRGTHLYNVHTAGPEWMTFQPANADKRRVQVRFDRPFTLPGPIPAMVTGTLVSTFRRNGQDEKRAFRVYNNRLVQDVAFPDTFYHAQIGAS